MLVGTLYARLLGNLLSGKGMFRAGYRHGNGKLRTDYKFKNIFSFHFILQQSFKFKNIIKMNQDLMVFF